MPDSAAAIVSAITELAADFGLEVIAESVNTSQQLVLVCTFGRKQAQGHHFSRPLPMATFEPAAASFVQVGDDERPALGRSRFAAVC